MKPFHVYLLRCADGSFYCGHTDNLDVRMHQHHVGTVGYTATRKPLALVWQGEFETRESALSFEQQIKGWSRAKKEALIAGNWPLIQQLAKSKHPIRPESPEVHPTPPVRPESVEAHPTPPVHPEPVEAHPTPPVRPEPVEGHFKASTSSARTDGGLKSSARTDEMLKSSSRTGGGLRSSTQTDGGFSNPGAHPPLAILSVNAGSSSLKFAVYPVQGGGVGDAVLTGVFEGLEPQGQPVMRLNGQVQALDHVQGDPFDSALTHLQHLLQRTRGLPPLGAVAHRVVHGGEAFTQAVRVTPEVMDQLSLYTPLAPLHQPHNLAGIAAFAKAFAPLPQIACFDTAFHATIPALHNSFALPEALRRQGVRRYGFHGLSYQFIMGQLQACSDQALGRVLMAHLGNGASLCAARAGQSVATTMGFSTLDGLMMGTRSGSLDPGVLLHLMAQGWSREQIETLLYQQSGLLGVSGISADMRTLRQSPHESARFATDLFAHRVVREAGAMVACLQGLDLIAFSGGIGEHDAALRQQVCGQLGWLGVEVDEDLNQAAHDRGCQAIHSADSAVEVWVIPTDEGRVSAQLALALL